MSRLTTVTVKSEKEIKKLVQCYAHRWKIEQFHFILKSGCKIEKNQAREYGRLSFLTLLYSVIAMQILNLTYLGKICPEISSGIVFAEEEWKVLCCCARKSKEIPEAYSLKEAIYDLGVLEGRKVLRAMVCPEYVLSGKDWMYYIHCLLIEIILYKYGSS